jgi:hypothetical protein
MTVTYNSDISSRFGFPAANQHRPSVRSIFRERTKPQPAGALHRCEPCHIHSNEGSGTLVITQGCVDFWNTGRHFHPGLTAAVADGLQIHGGSGDGG